MPLNQYGVLRGFVTARQPAANNKAHYEILVRPSLRERAQYRVAVDVHSQAKKRKLKVMPLSSAKAKKNSESEVPSDTSEVLFAAISNFKHSQLKRMLELPYGFVALPEESELRLDYVRQKLIDRKDMTPLPINSKATYDDFNDQLDELIAKALKSDKYELFAFGEAFGPFPNQKDKIFGFSPEQGIHDIHMNQGNVDHWVDDDGVFQDGALLLYSVAHKSWSAVFLAFQSQSWKTDDTTGHTLSPNKKHSVAERELILK